MKLHSIKVADYRILQNFSLDFGNKENDEQGYALDLIVGVNGTGKSTLLRLIATIFQYLERKEMPPFGFEIKYRLQGSRENDDGITTFSNLQEGSYERIENEQQLRVSYGLERNPSPKDPIAVAEIETSELPLHIVAFTTGSEREWNLELTDTGIFDGTDSRIKELPHPNVPQFNEQLTTWYLQELPGKPVNDSLEEGQLLSWEKFLFITAEHIPLVILCGMLIDILYAAKNAGKAFSWNRLSEVMRESHILSLRGFSFKLRMNKKVLSTEDNNFVDSLMQLAHHVIQTGSDYLLVFDFIQLHDDTQPEDTVSRRLLELGGSGIGLFKQLIQLAEPGGRLEPILRDVDLFLEKMPHQKSRTPNADDQKNEKPPLHLLRWLSDGEQSFLGRMCLISLLSDSEALLLLDEPEVHFNDYWKRQLVFLLHQALQQQQSHVLMTTHSSITLTDVSRENIQVLQRSNGYTNAAIPPPLRTLGADPSDIMVNVFGAENASGAQGVKYIEDRLSDLADLPVTPENNEKRKKQLKNLLGEVGPGYWRFLIRREIHALEGE